MSSFSRFRRMRINPELRKLRSETKLEIQDLIAPVFINESLDGEREISSMPGVFQYGYDAAIQKIAELEDLGILAVILFGIPTSKDNDASGAYSENGVIQNAIRQIKERDLKITVIADTCQCEYTANGQCGPLDRDKTVNNENTLEWLKKTALSQAKAGADIIAPSTMIDGMIYAIRETLDEEGFINTPILSYGAKYASSFYGPFRDAAGSSDEFCGDRKNHQMDPANREEAILELKSDIAEGADILMVKPAMTYLDIISDAKELGYPVWAYNVSGEYSLVKMGARAGICDEVAMSEEILMSIKRAGADKIITYFAEDFAKRNS
jgi:porphobilinogen synthase